MAKYSKEFKLKVVKYCIENYHTSYEAAKKFNIPSPTPIKHWIGKYNEHGEIGIEKNKKASYDGKYKQNVVEYMHTNHLSATQTAIHFKLSSGSTVTKWERIYYEEGPQALYEVRRGRNKNMSSKSRKKKLSKDVEEDLIAEVQRLRMENAYLKKLQALVQKRTKPKQSKK